MAVPCFCTMESIEDYVVINQQESTTTAPNSKFTALFVSNGQSNLVLRTNDCCTECNWRDFPNHDGDDHSNRAHSIFLNIHEKIQENRAAVPPPALRVTKLDLTGYKYQLASTSDDTFHSFYFLRIHAGDNFYLYVKVGVTKQEYTPAKLLRLSSKIDRVTCD